MPRSQPKSVGLTDWLSSLRRDPLDGREHAPRVLAIVREGPMRPVLQAISRSAGWILTLCETLPSRDSSPDAGKARVVLFDRELSPDHWHEAVRDLARTTPRPYIILLSPKADSNLWEELYRVGGSDIQNTSLNPDRILSAVRKGLRLWNSEQHVRTPVTR